MIETIHSEMVQRLASVYQAMDRQDEVHRAKLLDLIQKARKQEFVIAFCGHFSAGKSTMLNELFGEDLLPTSPIPTSANIVKIQSGRERVSLLLPSGESHTYDGAYTYQELKELCKNGEEVVAVYVYRDTSHLPEGVSFLDTPGIDSTDDAHRIATESALHLSDAIFYMMDYNHVQSEVNLQFVKELKQRQKRVFLVINQIDKHRKTELSFEQYQKSVRESFESWDIEADGIFYTSLRDLDHPFNQLEQLKQLINWMIADRGTLIQPSIFHEANYLVQAHLDQLEEKNRERFTRLHEQLNIDSLPGQEQIQTMLASLQREQEELTRQGEKVKTEYQQGIESILRNAYLMPYEVRELAHRYLETMKSNFKVGFLFSKTKTEKEKEDRAKAFYEKLKQTVETQVDIHVKQFVIQFLKHHHIYSESLGGQVYQSSISFEPSLLKKVIKTGAGLTGNYLLQYSEDLANEIKQAYRRLANSIHDSFADKIKEQLNHKRQAVHEKICMYEQYKQASDEIVSLQQQREAYKEELNQLLDGSKAVEHPVDLAALTAIEQTIPISNERFAVTGHKKSAEQPAVQPPDEKTVPASTDWPSRIKQILEHVKRSEAYMDGLVGLKTIRQEVKQKRQRAENKQFTVALFGAFSAGKSSFANALIGEQVLPVSPNPTTATINKICPPTAEHPHGETVIRFKSEDTLFQDLKQVYQLFQKEVNSLAEALQGIDSLCSVPAPHARQKATFPFLRAVQKGFPAFSAQLGSARTLNLKQFAEYVANEEKSCFVELAELYYDCPLTRQGVTLVDTPGADSIHARHTDVAFQYIKNADAILFVTYYNHPFSRADREFLIQLGRVKDTFSMDKMFFLINAADLASSKAELASVHQYIGDQLLQYGIRNPRLFPVSSLLALEEKKGGGSRKEGVLADSGITAFETAFTSFMMKDLMLVSLHSLKRDCERAGGMLTQMVRATRQANEDKQRQKQLYEQEKAMIIQTIQQDHTHTEEHALQQEIHELLYYVRQRLFLRYHDVFSEIINPSALRDDGGDLKQKLKSCVMELVDFMQHDLLQEMRATTLRIERWMNRKLDSHMDTLNVACKKINAEIPLSGKPDYSHDPPRYEKPFQELTIHSFKRAVSIFKNSKSFFEKNGKALMREEMKKILETAVAGYLEEQQERFFHHYQNEWRSATDQIKEKVQRDCDNYYESLLFACSEKVDPAAYEEAAAKIKLSAEEIEKEINQL
ncbi:dynamin family protein [Paenactinomyces guangxiensis]|uniref:Dynamin family protein n=1 Tax=Paenactinomyces guangxiensis TaxID=1490290 RepID=A0A7W2A7A0_9BACL|nr:dynamin family protein [Paenactinomyces guangxiensis]MBA4494311.1 dynamin family protein [Paenactinomyces guangxiensis]MBH8590805.1 dynamin family protein [Paenactinomyces guangxiensis]